MKKIALYLFLFVLFALMYRFEQIQQIDNYAVKGMEGLRSEAFTKFFLVMSEIGSIKVELPLLFFVSIILLFYGRILSKISLWFTLNSVRFLNFELKEFFHRERPSFDAVINAAHYSFPSGHSMNSAAVYGFICYLLIELNGTNERRKKWLIGMTILLIGLIGISRIYLGVHYLFDVLAGFSAGMAWLLILIKVYEGINSKIIDKTRLT